MGGVCEGVDVVVGTGAGVPVAESWECGLVVGVLWRLAGDTGLRSVASEPFVPVDVEATNGTVTAAAIATRSAATRAVSSETRPDEDRLG